MSAARPGSPHAVARHGPLAGHTNPFVRLLIPSCVRTTEVAKSMNVGMQRGRRLRGEAAMELRTFMAAARHLAQHHAAVPPVMALIIFWWQKAMAVVPSRAP